MAQTKSRSDCLANFLYGEREAFSKTADKKSKSELLKTASDLLSSSADKIEHLLTEQKQLRNEKVAAEQKCKQLSDELSKMKKTAFVSEIVNSMLDKGLLSCNEAQSKTASLMEMDDNALNQFQEAIASVDTVYKKNGVDSLQYLESNASIENNDRSDGELSVTPINYAFK